ncbi:PLP-dependent transferase [Fomitopsis serialis]|uniref:PLP-dependent transferase n=1 Tax=Fomitopsis serialis TaxID=139415 RepID=UPI002008CF5B|nr:PLP-dependent transferase [Neoantrodia serialis]KAH9934310.1 PLP-dependent transferase [Neoantrodia serialis]
MSIRGYICLAVLSSCGRPPVAVALHHGRHLATAANVPADSKAVKTAEDTSTASGAFHTARDLLSPIKHATRLTEGRALRQDVWSVFNAVNLPSDCINLGQGYMNFPPPDWAREGAQEALCSTMGNQYAHPKGIPRLRKAMQNFYGTQFHERELDMETEMMVTNGATEGQYAAFTAFVDPGDEVIIMEPFFDQYLQCVVFNGGVPVFVPLHPNAGDPGKRCKPTWTLDMDTLSRAITPRTKMIVLNTPHNPIGKVFTREELEAIAELADKHNLLVISDEVYEHLVYDREHVRFATLPGMWKRTITVGSAGKLFAATGWRVGWLIGPPALIAPAYAASLRLVYCANTPMQGAVAVGLEQAGERGFFETQTNEYKERKAILTDAFERLCLNYTQPEGAYFITVDVSNLQWPADYPFPQNIRDRRRDFHAAWFMAMEVGVAPLPLTDFYCDAHASINENYIRFSYAKDLNTLRSAAERLQSLKRYLK